MKNKHKIRSKVVAAVFGLAITSVSATTNAAEMQIFSNEQLEENSNLMILDYDNTGGDVKLQFGNTGLNDPELYHDGTGFNLTDDLNVEGDLKSTGNFESDGVLIMGTGDHQLTNTEGLIDGSKIQDATIDATKLKFGSGADEIDASDIFMDTSSMTNSSATDVKGALEDLDAKLTEGPDSTQANNFILDSDGDATDVSLQFGNTINESITWDNDGLTTGDGAFVFSDDVVANGVIVAGSGNIQITNATGNLNGGALAVDSVDDTSLDFGLGAGQINAEDLVADSSSLTNSSSGTTQGILTDLDAAITSRDADITANATNIATNTTGIATNATNISTNTTDIATNTTDITALETAVGDNQYTSTNKVALGDSSTEAISKLDAAFANIDNDLQGPAVESNKVSFGDVTVSEESGSGNHLANLYADVETGANPHQFYILKTTQSKTQDLDLKYKIKLPENFKDFANSGNLSFFYKNTGASATDSKVDIFVQDKDGDHAYAQANGQGLFSSNWSEFTQDFNGAGFNPVAGDYIYVTVRAYGKDNAGVNQSPYVGEIVLNYNVTKVN